MVENLCSLFGEKLCTLDGKDYHSFPAVEALAQPEVEAKLRVAGFGYRAPFVQGTARKILEQGGETWLQKLTSLEYPEAKRELMTLPGIGAKVKNFNAILPLIIHIYCI